MISVWTGHEHFALLLVLYYDSKNGNWVVCTQSCIVTIPTSITVLCAVRNEFGEDTYYYIYRNLEAQGQVQNGGNNPIVDWCSVCMWRSRPAAQGGLEEEGAH